MSFHITAANVELEKNRILSAYLPTRQGHGVGKWRTMNLDDVLGNDNGSFAWDWVNFSHSAQDIRLERQGRDKIPILYAKLRNAKGQWVDASVNLGERIANDEGEFKFV
ncbi:Cyanovirin-N [Aspergillus egyptiacus]|nr:Cyanovirin-N [Aspergillus egyptiacus]